MTHKECGGNSFTKVVEEIKSRRGISTIEYLKCDKCHKRFPNNKRVIYKKSEEIEYEDTQENTEI